MLITNNSVFKNGGDNPQKLSSLFDQIPHIKVQNYLYVPSLT